MRPPRPDPRFLSDEDQRPTARQEDETRISAKGSILDDPGHDTELARILFQAGRLDLETLQKSLLEARSQRGQVTLARALVSRRHLPEEEAAYYFERILAGDALSDSQEEAPTVAKATPGQTRGWAEPWNAGDMIGPYRLGEQLGAGGMGVVFRAVHEPSGTVVALKTLTPVADDQLKARFLREGEAQARVAQHASLVRVHDKGVHLGRHYFVMDVVQGDDLRVPLRSGPFPPREAARIARDIALGLAHMHEQGVLHRDVKPANILLDQSGRPRLVDFGIAHIDGAHSLTNTGDLLGTPAYMSPEQALGERPKIGPRSDVYSLCSVLYHLLTGRPPFTGASSVTLLTKVVTAVPVSPTTLSAEVPADLSQICLRGLSKDPEDRFSATELAAALDRYLRGEDLDPKAAPRPRGSSQTFTVVFGLLLFAAGLGFNHLREAVKPVLASPSPTLPTQHVSNSPSATRSPQREVGLRPSPTPPSLAAALLSFPTRTLRYELTIEADMVSSPWGREQLRLDLLNKFVMDWSAEPAGPGRYKVKSVLRGLVVNWSLTQNDQALPTFPPMNYDSARHSGQPFSAAIDKAWTFDFDARTGEVSQIEGTAAIDSAIVTGLAPLEARRHRVGAFSSAEGMQELLTAALGHYSGDAREWERRSDVLDLFGTRDQPERGGMRRLAPPSVVLKYRGDAGPHSILVNWRGKGEQLQESYPWTASNGETYQIRGEAKRDVEGSAEAQGGVPSLTELHETWSTLRTYSGPKGSIDEPGRFSMHVTLRRID